ncbi:RNA polymerase, sigma-24 subunit, ECF subfamily [Caldithrix abyssi DSM 13497]|uniref:RNA polymerase, sigma-24 subunit, ECF subfamily n=2 Tax=Caldithrix abyssi DSM 13497 TaxID=880073 RepID=H1XSM9_CALAY|nr:sigma-70 family RNA polymerase sigma factor [Caldithrix abyssi]EHO42577.1 RNA polymerase, sigma-24 subunit, ECF subfamily [Caldithrix abyssi DSM 13497]
MKLTVQTDQELWNAFRQGNPEALAEIFTMNYAALYNFAFTICHNDELSKDSIQELFTYLWEKRDKLAEVKSIRLYLFTSLQRLLIKELKKSKSKEEKNKIYQDEFPDHAFSAQDLCIFEEINEHLKQKLKSALDEIPQRMREALYLKTYNNFSYKEISQIMNISSQVARNYVSEALHRLRKILS